MAEKQIEDMNFKELRNEVRLLSDQLAIWKRKYEDILYNLDDDNFSSSILKEKDGMKTQIKVTADGLLVTVSKDELEGKLLNYSTLSQTAEAITSTVTSEYVTDLIDGEYVTYTTYNSQMQQTAEAISTKVSKTLNFGTAESGTVHPDRLSAPDSGEGLYFFDTTNENERGYYYFNSISGEWEKVSDSSIYSAFEQTANGFELSGLVKINGNLITEGTISADRIDTDNLSCTRLYSQIGKSHYAKIASDVGDFGIYGSSASNDANPKNVNCSWGLYDSDDGAINFYSYGNNYMGYNHNQNVTYPKGDWSFGSCTIADWGSNAPVAVFG